MRFCSLLSMIMLWLVCFPVQAGENPFRVEVISAKGHVGKPIPIGVRLIIPPNHFIYRDQISIKAKDLSGMRLSAPEFPTGSFAPDPVNTSAMRELFDKTVVIQVPVSATKSGSFTPVFDLRYQGCRKGLCYPPEELKISSTVIVKNGGAKLSKKQPVVAATPLPTPDFSGLPKTAVSIQKGADGKQHPVIARLLVDSETVTPGKAFRLGVHLTQQKKWHTYWKSPGGVGQPTEITWKLPPNSQSTAFQFPIPVRYEADEIISYGYDDQVLFFTEVILPADTPPGELTLGADSKWLVCEKQCIPGEASLALPVKVTKEADQKNAFASMFDSFAKQHPMKATDVKQFSVETALSVAALQSEKKFSFALYLNPMGGKPLKIDQSQGTWPFFTPIVEGNWSIEQTSVNSTKDGGVVVILSALALEVFPEDPLPTNNKIGGLFQLDIEGEKVRTEVTAKLPWATADAKVETLTSPLFALAGAANTPQKAKATATTDKIPAKAVDQSAGNFIWMLIMAFAGGVILNIMPCVLPVLTLKLFSLISQQNISAQERRNAGLVYTLGIVVSFWVLAAAAIILRTVFSFSVGWGTQFQYPGFVIVLATIVFVFGLSLLGVFEVPTFGANKAANASSKGGLLGYFLTGVFTTLLATPCTAPLLAPAMGFAFSLPSYGIVIFFTVAALGLAFPFLLIAFIPFLMKFFPQPGAWMDTFKNLMGFTLIATTVWLVDVLGGQTGEEGVWGFLAFLTVVSFAAWLFGKFGSVVESAKRQLSMLVLGVVLSVLAGFQFLTTDFVAEDTNQKVSSSDLDFSEKVPWQPFSECEIEKLNGRVIFVDFTADWCFTCKVNEKTIIEQSSVRDAMKAHNVIPMKADWTKRNATITKWLERYGRAGVPFYLVIPADKSKENIPLGEVITPSSLIKAFEQAG